MATKELKNHTLAEMKERYIGKIGTQERDKYECKLRVDILGKRIKTAGGARSIKR